MLEPFDPAYLQEKTEIPQLSDAEVTYVKRVGAMETLLKAARIPFVYEYDGRFVISKPTRTGYPVVAWVDVYEDCYTLSQESREIAEGEINVVMNSLTKWYRNEHNRH